MKINDKHKYDIDIIEIKIFLDEMSKNRFDQNFINTYNLIINNSIDSLGLTFEKIKDVVTNRYYLSVLEEDLKGTLFFALLSYQLFMVEGHRIQLVLDYHLQNTKNTDTFINQIEFFVLGQLENYNEDFLNDFRLYEITEWVIRNRTKENTSYNSSKESLQNKKSSIIDERIDCNEDVEYIEDYFMKLNTIIGDDGINPIMEKEDILYLLRANFKGFEPKEKIKKFKLNFKVENPFTYFLYDFYCYRISQQRKHHKKYYIDLLFNNFTMYDTKVRETVSKNFSRVPTKKLEEY